jgi:tRNA 2-thiouridine synthesizing protein B
MLHIISTFDGLALCLQVIQKGDVLLFIEDGVNATITTLHADLVKSNTFSLYALQADVTARGLLDKMDSNIQLIDYAQFVELTVLHTPIQNWT